MKIILFDTETNLHVYFARIRIHIFMLVLFGLGIGIGIDRRRTLIRPPLGELSEFSKHHIRIGEVPYLSNASDVHTNCCTRCQADFCGLQTKISVTGQITRLAFQLARQCSTYYMCSAYLYVNVYVYVIDKVPIRCPSY